MFRKKILSGASIKMWKPRLETAPLLSDWVSLKAQARVFPRTVEPHSLQTASLWKQSSLQTDRWSPDWSRPQTCHLYLTINLVYLQKNEREFARFTGPAVVGPRILGWNRERERERVGREVVSWWFPSLQVSASRLKGMVPAASTVHRWHEV